MSIRILIDTSHSMADKIETARTAVERFLGALHADDEVFTITFATTPVLQQDCYAGPPGDQVPLWVPFA